MFHIIIVVTYQPLFSSGSDEHTVGKFKNAERNNGISACVIHNQTDKKFIFSKDLD